MLSAREFSRQEAGPSSCDPMEDVETKDLGSFESHGNFQAEEGVDEVMSSTSQPSEGILVANPRLKIKEKDLGKLRYLYKIPKSMEICAPEAHERVDWVVPSWEALYNITFKDGMRFLIPKLVRDDLDHFEITPSQLMPNTWRILMALECLSMRQGVACEIGEVLHLYYLKEHDNDKGWYQLIVRKD